MKISKAMFGQLSDAVDSVMQKHSLKVVIEHRNGVKFAKSQFVAFCWSIFHASKFDCSILYNAGLNDNHIETALKRILSDFE